MLWQVALSGVRKGGATVAHQINYRRLCPRTTPTLAASLSVAANVAFFMGPPSPPCRSPLDMGRFGLLPDREFPMNYARASPI